MLLYFAGKRPSQLPKPLDSPGIAHGTTVVDGVGAGGGGGGREVGSGRRVVLGLTGGGLPGGVGARGKVWGGGGGFGPTALDMRQCSTAADLS